jgi:hypothetical protein
LTEAVIGDLEALQRILNVAQTQHIRFHLIIDA